MIHPPKKQLKLLSGRSHPVLAQTIAQNLGLTLCPVEFTSFTNGEIGARIMESVRGDDAFIIQSHAGSVNDSIMEQAIMIDSAKRASAGSITAVCPFFAYARQDRKSHGRDPISARLMIDILVRAGADRIVSIDLHTGQIQGFMDGPFDHLTARPLLTDYLAEEFSPANIVIVAPDAGRVKSAERYGNALGCDIAIVHKHRSATSGTVEARFLIGKVTDKTAVLIDDMVDTAGTLCAAADLLAQNGAKEIHAVATHGIFSGPAKERIAASSLKKIIVTDTLPQDKGIDKIKTISVAPILAAAIKEIYTGGSVSALFPGGNQF